MIAEEISDYDFCHSEDEILKKIVEVCK